MRTAVVLMVVALAGCATTGGESESVAGKCASLARPAIHAPIERSWVQSIDPQVALSSFQLYCMKDTPLGL